LFSCCEKIGESGELLQRRELARDSGEVMLYREEPLEATTVGRLWEEAMAR
jgi:hypothetical protein